MEAFSNLLTEKSFERHQIGSNVLKVIEGSKSLFAQQDYIRFCINELDLLHRGSSRQTRQSETLTIKTCSQLLAVVKVLHENLNLTRPELRQILEKHFSNSDIIGLNRSIHLAVRLWLMLNFQDEHFDSLKRATCLEWDDISTLNGYVTSLFPIPQWEVSANTSRLSPHFKASFLVKVCGWNIDWTSNIYDHLRLDHRKGYLRVFPYKHHLLNLLASNDGQYVCPIPREVLHETLRTLDLLFPVWDRDTINLLKEGAHAFHEIGPFTSSVAAVNLMGFYYWRDRLLELREVLDSPPVSWAQLWRDRRNPQQFWTFWIALVILVLTCLSLITGIIQAWASVKSLNLALELANGSQSPT